jgi:hypothetical protein
VDAKIRRLKKVYRAVKSGLQWQLPGSLVKDLVAYAVSRINIQHTSALSEKIATRVAFTGMPVQYQKELRFAFGDYVEAHEEPDKTSRPHSAACIALFPVGNSTGSRQLFKISSRTRVRRTNMVKLVTSSLVINAMIAIAEEEVETTKGNQGILEVGNDQQSTDKEGEGEDETPSEHLEEIRPVKRASIKAGTKILKSHMFVVTKYLASGEFDKMKARLVADGRDQDPELYPNKSSPTVALHSVFTVLGLVAGHKWRIAVKIDIKGAFLQTPMEGMWKTMTAFTP